MIIQHAKNKQSEQTNTKKMMEWESPNRIDENNGDTIGERRL